MATSGNSDFFRGAVKGGCLGGRLSEGPTTLVLSFGHINILFKIFHTRFIVAFLLVKKSPEISIVGANNKPFGRAIESSSILIIRSSCFVQLEIT